MKKMSLGSTLEEKRETYKILTKNSKKWGKVFAILSVVLGFWMSIILLSAMENIFIGLLIAAFMLVAGSIGYYWYGQIVYYGYLAIKVFLHEQNIGAGTVAEAVGTSVLVSYVLGGKKATKKLGIAWLVILIIALTIGIFAGLYYYIKFYKEAKELGFVSKSKIKFFEA